MVACRTTELANALKFINVLWRRQTRSRRRLAVQPEESIGRSQIKEVLERSINDDAFRRQLLDDPDSALIGYELSEVQLILLRSLEQSDLDKLTPANLDEYFTVDSAVYTPDGLAELERSYEHADSDVEAKS
jgi:hypothetical protein